jgi:2'-5' RNA ligase
MSNDPPRGPFHGVISLLDAGATERIRETWTKLEREFGLRGVLVMPYPHFSYQIAGGYDRPSLESTMSRLAEEIAPFEIRTRGLSTFVGLWPVVYVAVKKDSFLRALHARIWNACLPHAREAVAYYFPEAWTPHITLAHGEERNSRRLTRDQVRSVLGTLNPKDFRWTISIDNLALVWDDGTVQRPVRTFPFRGG